MSPREKKNCQWRRYIICHDVSWIRELCRSSEDLSFEIPRSEKPCSCHSSDLIFILLIFVLLISMDIHPIEVFIICSLLYNISTNFILQTQATRSENKQARPGSQGFGSTAAAGSSSSTTNPNTGAAFAEPSNNSTILSGQSTEVTDQDPAAYGALYGSVSGHNGSGEGY